MRSLTLRKMLVRVVFLVENQDKIEELTLLNIWLTYAGSPSRSKNVSPW